jgi:predicted RNase H-like HicB family nuclease
MRRYLIVIEKAKRSYSAYSPDLPGCVATAATAAATRKRMKEAIEFHLEGLRAEGLPVPEPQATSDYVTIG